MSLEIPKNLMMVKSTEACSLFRLELYWESVAVSETKGASGPSLMAPALWCHSDSAANPWQRHEICRGGRAQAFTTLK